MTAQTYEADDAKEKKDIDFKRSWYIVKRLLKYVGKRDTRLLYPLAIFVAINVLFSWLTPLIFRDLVDEGLGGGIGATSGDIDVIIFLGTLFFFLTIGGVLARIVQNYIISKLATLTMYHLRRELFEKFQSLGLDYHDSPDKTAGKKISYLTNDVNTIQELIQSGLLMVVGNFFLIFGAVIFMIFLSPLLTLISFMIIPLILLIGGFIFKKARKYFKELRERVSTVTSELNESILGMRIIQSFAVEQKNAEEFIEATESERKTTMKAGKLMAFVPPIVIYIMTFGLATLFFTAGILIREGTITQGTLVAFIFYIFMFFQPLINLIGFFTLLQNSIAAGNRMVKLLDEKASIQDAENPLKLPETIKGKIEYKNVSFEYEEGQPVLRNINLKIEEKERLALVGYTGAGKSTFIKLLSRFYDPKEGKIKLDGIDLREIQIEDLRTKLGIVLQENFLFSGTVKENIRYGKLDATDEEIIEAATKVSAHEMIMNLEKGYDTEVGERGRNLSEGQRQLVSFARTLIANPPILILDEATSSIDPYSELLIQEALETLLEGRTSISIAHRLSTIINSDRIVAMKNGQIIEEGTHEDLVKKGEFYKHLYEMQFKDPFEEKIA
ncbi:MAG: ABC transporter ATP-binding protein [Promethearchaeia archaeon]